MLGIETSCDETAAAVVRGRPPGPGEILSNSLFSQTEAHAPYGGVVPEIASRAHLEILDGIIEKALGDARITLDAIQDSLPRTLPIAPAPNLLTLPESLDWRKCTSSTSGHESYEAPLHRLVL